MKTNLVEQTIVIVADFFNPSAFGQYWFIKEKLLDEHDILKESLFVPGITHVQSNKFNILVVPDKIQIVLKCRGDEAYNMASKILTKIVESQKDIPYKALGFNFSWELNPQEPISVYSRAIFCKDGLSLYDNFNEGNARFGMFVSQNYKDARMNLDIKPVSSPEKEYMMCNFNFHHDISEANDVVDKLQDWKDCLDKSNEIVNCL